MPVLNNRGRLLYVQSLDFNAWVFSVLLFVYLFMYWQAIQVIAYSMVK